MFKIKLSTHTKLFLLLIAAHQLLSVLTFHISSFLTRAMKQQDRRLSCKLTRLPFTSTPPPPCYYTREWAAWDIVSPVLVSFVVTAHLLNLGVCWSPVFALPLRFQLYKMSSTALPHQPASAGSPGGLMSERVLPGLSALIWDLPLTLHTSLPQSHVWHGKNWKAWTDRKCTSGIRYF